MLLLIVPQILFAIQLQILKEENLSNNCFDVSGINLWFQRVNSEYIFLHGHSLFVDLLRDTFNDGTNIDVFSYFHKL